MRSLSAKQILLIKWFLLKYPNKNCTIFLVSFQQQFFAEGNLFYQVYASNHIGTINILAQPEFGSHWLTVRIAQEAVDLCMQTLKEAKYDRGTTAGQKWLGHGNTNRYLNCSTWCWVGMFLFDALHMFGVGIDVFTPHLDDDLWRFLQSSLLALLANKRWPKNTAGCQTYAQSWVESISFVHFESNFTLPRNINIESSHIFFYHTQIIYTISICTCQILH